MRSRLFGCVPLDPLGDESRSPLGADYYPHVTPGDDGLGVVARGVHGFLSRLLPGRMSADAKNLAPGGLWSAPSGRSTQPPCPPSKGERSSDVSEPPRTPDGRAETMRSARCSYPRCQVWVSDSFKGGT